MKGVYKLAAKELRRNLRRTVLTVLGIILTVALLSCAFHFFTSYQMMMRKEIIARTGLWHVQYSQVGENSFHIIAEDENTSSWFVQQMAVTFVGNDTELTIAELSPEVVPNMNLTLLEGRLPEKPGEVAVVKTYRQLFPLGETVTLEAGRLLQEGELLRPEDAVLHRNNRGEYIKTSDRNYTVVGIVEPVTNAWGFAPVAQMYGVFDQNSFRPGETADMFVEAGKVWSGLEKWSLELAERAKTPYSMNLDGTRQYLIGYNSELLMTYGVTNRQGTTEMIVWMVLAFVLVVIMAGAALIYNAFAVSVSERTRQLGILASVGATKKQRRRMVYFEGLFQAGLGIPLGLLVGLAFAYGAVKIVGAILENLQFSQYHLELVISPAAMAITAFVGLFTVFAAVLVPAIRAGRLTPIEAIRQSKDIKLRHEKMRLWFLWDRFLKFPEKLGLKNLKRNRKRYRVTVISLSISVVLFLTTSSYLFYARKAIDLEYPGITYDVQVQTNGYLSEIDLRGMEESLSVPIENRVWTSICPGDAFLKSEQYNQQYVENFMPDGLNVTNPFSFAVCVADEASLETYLKQAGITERPQWNDGKPTAILIDCCTLEDQGKLTQIRHTTLQPGDTLSLHNSFLEGTQAYLESATTVKISAVTEKIPKNPQWDISSAEISLTLLVTEETQRMLLKETGQPYSAMGLYTVKNHTQFCEEVEAYTKNGSRFGAVDFTEMREARERLLLAIGIGAFSFVGMITLLCAVNMFGAIQTSMNLRRRELAMLSSVGMDKRALWRMLAFESLCYGLKALAIGLPLSLLMDLLLHRFMQFGYVTSFSFPWKDFALAAVVVLLLTWLFMMAAFRSAKKQNLADELRIEQ